jgi:hypothetical protein
LETAQIAAVTKWRGFVRDPRPSSLRYGAKVVAETSLPGPEVIPFGINASTS